ncbi:MAG: hisH [Bacteroidota bacterium]|nr:hisH [Bacteroidota bacterium]
MNLVVIKYNAGNTKSVEHTLSRLGVQAVITDDAEQIQNADKVIFPGVGHAEATMKYLKEKNLDKVIKNITQPFLGICLGQQLMCAHSEEGDVDCLGIFPVKVKKFKSADNHIKIPQMGWNNLYDLKSPLFKNIPDLSFVYFVHSYYSEVNENTIATCDYIHPFSAALQKDNFYATQFHPEKSADAGQKIIQNFIELC